MSSGSRIIESIDEILAWQKGEGTMRITFPGEAAQDLTYAEYIDQTATKNASAQEAEERAALVLRDLEAHRARDTHPFWTGWTLEHDRPVTITTSANLLRVIVAGEVVYRRNVINTALSLEEVCRLANLRIA